jgi:hypothetical protein
VPENVTIDRELFRRCLVVSLGRAALLPGFHELQKASVGQNIHMMIKLRRFFAETLRDLFGRLRFAREGAQEPLPQWVSQRLYLRELR